MSKRNLDYERWEVLLMTLFLAFRWLIFICGCILLIYGVATWAAFQFAAVLAIGLSIILFGMFLSDRTTLYVARFIAWLMTIKSDQN